MQSTRIDRLLQISIALLLGVFVIALYGTIHENIVNVGDSAPDFSVKTDTGGTISLHDFGGKVLILNFWATWCPPCIEELPSLDQLSRRFKGQGVVVLGVSVDKDEKAYRNFLQRARVSFETSRDPEQKLNREYGTVQFPETYIIDRNGKVVEKVISSRNWMDEGMVNRVQGLL